MKEIAKLHLLNKEVEQLEVKYDLALDWLFKTRKALGAVLKLVDKEDIETIKEYFITSSSKDWETYKEELDSFAYITDTLNKQV